MAEFILSTEESTAPAGEPARMGWPMRCKHCGGVHDAMGVEVLQRYSDCSVWKCPNCGAIGDDRPLRWGGSFERVSANDAEPARPSTPDLPTTERQS